MLCDTCGAQIEGCPAATVTVAYMDIGNNDVLTQLLACFYMRLWQYVYSTCMSELLWHCIDSAGMSELP